MSLSFPHQGKDFPKVPILPPLGKGLLPESLSFPRWGKDFSQNPDPSPAGERTSPRIPILPPLGKGLLPESRSFPRWGKDFSQNPYPSPAGGRTSPRIPILPPPGEGLRKGVPQGLSSAPFQATAIIPHPHPSSTTDNCLAPSTVSPPTFFCLYPTYPPSTGNTKTRF